MWRFAVPSDKLGPLTQAAIAQGRLPAELSAETYANIADALMRVATRKSKGGKHVQANS